MPEKATLAFNKDLAEAEKKMENLENFAAERRYDRIAWIFDILEFPMEMMAARRWREKLFSMLEGESILEVGVGTGRNLAYYPPGKRVTGIDISERMLARARKKAARLSPHFELLKMDVQALEFSDRSFDSLVSTFVFCSVPDPVKGLEEARRTLRAKSKAYFLEHVRPGGFRGWIFDFLNPLILRLMGSNINRDTIRNIKQAGFDILREENLFSDIFKLVIAERT